MVKYQIIQSQIINLHLRFVSVVFLTNASLLPVCLRKVDFHISTASVEKVSIFYVFLVFDCTFLSLFAPAGQ